MQINSKFKEDKAVLENSLNAVRTARDIERTKIREILLLLGVEK